MNKLLLFVGLFLAANLFAVVKSTSCLCDCVLPSSAPGAQPARLLYCNGTRNPAEQEFNGQTFFRCSMAYAVEEAYRFPKCLVCDLKAVEACTKESNQQCMGWYGNSIVNSVQSGEDELNTILFSSNPKPALVPGVYKNCSLLEETL